MTQRNLQDFGVAHQPPHHAHPGHGPVLISRSPIDGRVLANVHTADAKEVQATIDTAAAAFPIWRMVPAPVRGEFVRRLGEKFRQREAGLAALVSLESGKSTSEAVGEVQEMIDIADFAVGLSRQLYGLTITSERARHRMMEQWHPLGPVGVITAFNFPVAVWAWNAMLGLVCGDPIIWKPSEKTPVCALACQALWLEVMDELEAEGQAVPEGILQLVVGGADAGDALCRSEKVPLISATGSTAMGRKVAVSVAQRMGRTLLELGGNNGLIVTPSADLDLALRAIVFAAAGTCGQRCTTLRRLIVHKSIKEALVKKLVSVYAKLKIGDPSQEGVLIGPLIDQAAFKAMQLALVAAKAQGGKVIFGGDPVIEGVPEHGCYVRPAIVEMPAQTDIVKHETFAPILYVLEYEKFEDAVALHSDVPQGLSSAIFTTDVREAERFMSPEGSDCGIANVNIGTSGAEIGGAFGGEKQTGGGRESGSDAWKAYMRRTTNTINYSSDLPLAQGVSFEV